MKYPISERSSNLTEDSVGDFTLNGLRITPKIVKFTRTLSGESLQKKLVFSNISKKTIRFIISRPYSSAFTVSDEGVIINLGPGIAIAKKLTYSNTDNNVTESAVPIRVNEVEYTIPITVERVKALITVTPTHLDFGVMNVGSKFSIRSMQLRNIGDCTGKFIVDVNSNNFSIMAEPRGGRLKPGSDVNVNVTIAGREPGDFSNEYWITSETPVRICITVSVIIPCLKIYHVGSSKDFAVLDFRNAFYGTCCSDTFLIHNYSSEATTFVVLGEYKNDYKSLSLIQSNSTEFDWINIRPLEGRLAPFEARVFTVRFCPTKPRDNQSVFWSLLKVARVDVKDTRDDNASINQFETELVKIAYDDLYMKDTTLANEVSVCVYGKVEEADIEFEPHEVHCKLKTNESCVKSVAIINCSNVLEIEYEYIHVPQVDVCPNRRIIGPSERVEVSVIMKTGSTTAFQKEIAFNIISYCNLSDKKKKIILKKKILPLNVEVEFQRKVPQTSTGSTFHFKKKDDFPAIKCAKCPHKSAQRRETTIGNKSLNKVNLRESSMILKSKRDSIRKKSELSKKAIRGLSQYLQPLEYKSNLPTERFYFKKAKFESYRLMKKTKENRTIFTLKSNTPEAKNPSDYDISDPRHYLLLGMPTNKIKLGSCKTQNSESQMNCFLVPLTPTQLYSITVMPVELGFGKIPILQEVSIVLKIENLNFFPIKITFLPHYDLKVNRPCVTVRGFSKECIEVRLLRKYIGLFYSNFSYIINSNHTFHKKVIAEGVRGGLEVTPKILHLRPACLFDLSDEVHSKLTVYNPFTTPVPFSWKSLNSNLEIIPWYGTVAPKKCLICLVYLKDNLNQFETCELLLQTDEGRNEIRVKLIIEPPRPVSHEVMLITRQLALGSVAIGLPYERKAFLFNNGKIATRFSIKSVSPVKGVEVYPKHGIITPKALQALTISFFFDCLMLIDFYLHIIVQNKYTLKLHVTGRTVFPEVEFNPEKICLLKTCCYSYSTTPIQVYNRSKAEVKLQFLMNDFVQFKISLSDNYLDAGIQSEGIHLLAGGYCTLYLHFTPKALHSYEFILPVVINNLIGPPSVNRVDSTNPSEYLRTPSNKARFTNTPQELPSSFSHVTIDCCIKQAEMVLPETRFEFFSNDIKKKYEKVMTVENPSSSVLLFQLDKADTHLKPFTIHPADTIAQRIYCIPPKDSIKFLLYFNPVESGSWECLIPVFIVSNNDLFLYNNIQLVGICYSPCLYCDVSELFFLPVPLNVQMEKTITLIASQQTVDTEVSVKFRHEHNEDVTSRHLQVTFPNGKQIPKNKGYVQIPVVVTFRSSEPISRKTVIIFQDGLNGQCSVPIYASAKCSLISTHIYRAFMNSSNGEIEDEIQSESALTKFYSEGMLYSGSLISTDSQDFSTVERRSYLYSDHHPFDSRHPSESSAMVRESSRMSMPYFEDWDLFPEFPPPNVKTHYTGYLKRSTRYVSKWLLIQALNGIYQPKIGVDIALTKSYRDFIEGHPINCPVKTTIDLLLQLFGSELMDAYGIPCNIPLSNDLDRIVFCLHLFHRVIEFLESKGNGLAHIIPLYLLSYEDYITLCKYERGTNNFYYTKNQQILKNNVVFERISKQIWLDLYVQLYKTHILDTEVCLCYKRLSNTAVTESAYTLVRLNISVHSFITQTKSIPISDETPRTTVSDIKGEYCMGEKVLLAWLTDSCKKAAVHDFPVPKLDGPIADFKESLSDCLVLAAVTAYYCPFLIHKYLDKLFLNPSSPEELKHNSNCLLLAWDSLRIQFSLKTWDIINGDPIFMLMLISELYFSLPEYLPSFTLNFKIPLGSTSTQVVYIQNHSNETITYETKIFQSSMLFNIEDMKDLYTIGPKEKISLKVRFSANRTTQYTGDLVLMAPRNPGVHGRNNCIKLIGEPSRMTISSKFTVHLPVNRLTYLNLKILSPYEKGCVYDIYMTLVKPTPEDSFETHRLSKETCNLPLEMYIGQSEVTSKSKKFFYLPLAVCCHSSVEKNYWILLSNKMVGEFIVKVELVPHTIYPQTLIKVNFPVIKDNKPDNPISIKPVNLSIPSMNSVMWNAAADMINLTLSPRDLFWDKYIVSPIGMKLFEYEVSRYCPYSGPSLEHFFRKKVTYKLDWDSDFVLGPKELVISDVHSNEFVTLKMLVDKSADEQFSTLLSLTSEDGKEVRTYKVEFIPTYVNQKDSSVK